MFLAHNPENYFWFPFPLGKGLGVRLFGSIYNPEK
jgi:hypothetical protein